MALIIEDGTIVVGANSYIDISTTKSYAEARGVDLGSNDALLEQWSIKAVDYLESLNYRGVRTRPKSQPLSWPRNGVNFEGYIFDDSKIPDQIKKAQAQLVIELSNGVVLFASSNASSKSAEKFVKREKVDTLEVEYAVPSEITNQLSIAEIPAVSVLLRGLLKPALLLFAYKG